MKIIGIPNNVAEEIDKMVDRHRDKFRSRANFATEASLEKIEKVKKEEYTAIAFSQLLKRFPKEVENAILDVLKMIGSDETIANFMDFLIDADNAIYFEGNKEDICKKIKSEIKDISLIDGAYLIMFSSLSPENVSAQIVDFLRALDSCIPEKAKRIMNHFEKKDVKELYGRLILKLKNENEKK